MNRLELDVAASGLVMFLPLLQKGVKLPAQTGGSVRQFVCDQLGVAEDYLEQRIQTLFLDARPVDDVDQAIIRDGACLALSAAMPGLLGATMRKGGRYAAFRREISAGAEEVAAIAANGTVTLKLFNMVAREVGEGLLAGGVTVAGGDLKRIVVQPEAQSYIRTVRVDGIPADSAKSVFERLADDPLELTVRIVDD